MLKDIIRQVEYPIDNLLENMKALASSYSWRLPFYWYIIICYDP